MSEKIHTKEEEEEEPIMDSSFFDDPTTTNHFSNLSVTTHHPPCSTCGCTGSVTAAPTSSSVSHNHNHKRPSSEPSIPPNPKKQNVNSPFAFFKIPLPAATTAALSSSSLSPSQPPLRRTVSDPCDPPSALLAAELTQSPPQQNPDLVACSGTPFSAAKLPPRPPTLRRSVSDPTPSPANTFSGSCDTGAAYESPKARWARRVGTCLREMTREWDELLSIEEESVENNDTKNQNSSQNVESNDATLGNPEEACVEAVAEKIGEFSSIRLTCPCGRSYQILLSGQNCFYRVS